MTRCAAPSAPSGTSRVATFTDGADLLRDAAIELFELEARGWRWTSYVTPFRPPRASFQNYFAHELDAHDIADLRAVRISLHTLLVIETGGLAKHFVRLFSVLLK